VEVINCNKLTDSRAFRHDFRQMEFNKSYDEIQGSQPIIFNKIQVISKNRRGRFHSHD
jgi:hypothetical protein